MLLDKEQRQIVLAFEAVEPGEQGIDNDRAKPSSGSSISSSAGLPVSARPIASIYCSAHARQLLVRQQILRRDDIDPGLAKTEIRDRVHHPPWPACPRARK
jgi:hypothetical protein